MPLAAAPAWAEDDAVSEETEFETFHIGLKGGFWYRPSIRMNAQVSGLGIGGGLPVPLRGTEIDLERDLGVGESPHSDISVDLNAEAVLEFMPFVETRWVGVYGWFVVPFEYRGKKVVERSLQFGNGNFTASTTVDSKFRQLFFGTDVTINIFNNRFFRIAPLVGLRALGVDWEVKTTTTAGPVSNVQKGDTSDLKSPLQLGDFQILPHPEIGALFAVGYRDYIDVTLRLATAYVNYLGMQGATYRVEFSVTAYPVPWVGIELGARYLEYDLSSQANQGKRGAFDFDLEFGGLTIALIVRL